LIKNLIPVGCNTKIDRRELINAVFYIVKTGCQWRQLPKDFPKWTTTYSFFKRNEKIWEKIMNEVIKKDKEIKLDLEESVIIIDSQSIKTNGKFKKKALMDLKE
jgi:putative transposase